MILIMEEQWPGTKQIDSPTPQWEKPPLEEEKEEIERTAEELDIPLEKIILAFNEAVLEELSDTDWDAMINCDSKDRGWTTVEEVRAHLQRKRDFTRIEDGMKNNQAMPAAGVLFRKNEKPYLIWGNSRLLGCRVLNIRPKVLAIRID